MKKIAKEKPGTTTQTGPTRKEFFADAVAEYLVGDQARMSILLQMGKPEAQAWAKIRGLTPLMGYPTVEEAKALMRQFLCT